MVCFEPIKYFPFYDKQPQIWSSPPHTGEVTQGLRAQPIAKGIVSTKANLIFSNFGTQANTTFLGLQNSHKGKWILPSCFQTWVEHLKEPHSTLGDLSTEIKSWRWQWQYIQQTFPPTKDIHKYVSNSVKTWLKIGQNLWIWSYTCMKSYFHLIFNQEDRNQVTMRYHFLTAQQKQCKAPKSFSVNWFLHTVVEVCINTHGKEGTVLWSSWPTSGTVKSYCSGSYSGWFWSRGDICQRT